MRAVEKGNETAIVLLLEKGASLGFYKYGQSPLSLAQGMGNRAIIDLLESRQCRLPKPQ